MKYKFNEWKLYFVPIYPKYNKYKNRLQNNVTPAYKVEKTDFNLCFEQANYGMAIE